MVQGYFKGLVLGTGTNKNFCGTNLTVLSTFIFESLKIEGIVWDTYSVIVSG